MKVGDRVRIIGNSISFVKNYLRLHGYNYEAWDCTGIVSKFSSNITWIYVESDKTCHLGIWKDNLTQIYNIDPISEELFKI